MKLKSNEVVSWMQSIIKDAPNQILKSAAKESLYAYIRNLPAGTALYRLNKDDSIQVMHLRCFTDTGFAIVDNGDDKAPWVEHRLVESIAHPLPNHDRPVLLSLRDAETQRMIALKRRINDDQKTLEKLKNDRALQQNQTGSEASTF